MLRTAPGRRALLSRKHVGRAESSNHRSCSSLRRGISDQFRLMLAKAGHASHDRRREGHTTPRKDDERDSFNVTKGKNAPWSLSHIIPLRSHTAANSPGLMENTMRQVMGSLASALLLLAETVSAKCVLENVRIDAPTSSLYFAAAWRRQPTRSANGGILHGRNRSTSQSWIIAARPWRWSWHGETISGA